MSKLALIKFNESNLSLQPNADESHADYHDASSVQQLDQEALIQVIFQLRKENELLKKEKSVASKLEVGESSNASKFKDIFDSDRRRESPANKSLLKGFNPDRSKNQVSSHTGASSGFPNAVQESFSTSLENSLSNWCHLITEKLLADDNNRSYHSTRKSLPKLMKFGGDPKKWLSFKEMVYYIKDAGKYSDVDMKNKIYEVLEGPAAKLFQGMMTSCKFETIMQMLEDKFGCLSTIIAAHAEELEKIKISSQDFSKRDATTVITILIQYFNVCYQAGFNDVPDSHSLGVKIYNMLPEYYKREYKNSKRKTSQSKRE